MPRKRTICKTYNRNSIDSKITLLCTEIKHLKDQMASSLDEDKRMHGIINKWLLVLTLLFIAEMIGGPAWILGLVGQIAIAG